VRSRHDAEFASAFNPVGAAYFGKDARDPGLVTAKDLAAYKPVWRTPASTTYRGCRVFGPPAPSGGAVTALEMLNILEGFDLKKFGFGSADAIHAYAETEKVAWADGSKSVGDPAYVQDNTARLTSK